MKPEATKEFQNLWQKAYGKSISFELAEELGEGLVELFETFGPNENGENNENLHLRSMEK